MNAKQYEKHLRNLYKDLPRTDKAHPRPEDIKRYHDAKMSLKRTDAEEMAIDIVKDLEIEMKEKGISRRSDLLVWSFLYNMLEEDAKKAKKKKGKDEIEEDRKSPSRSPSRTKTMSPPKKSPKKPSRKSRSKSVERVFVPESPERVFVPESPPLSPKRASSPKPKHKKQTQKVARQYGFQASDSGVVTAGYGKVWGPYPSPNYLSYP